MKPSKKDIQKWCKALRSGEYKQTKETLQDENGFCCLGVACDLFIPKEKQSLYIDEPFMSGDMPHDQPYSPDWLVVIEKEFRKVSEELLTCLNDDKDFTFDEIADVLEAVYIHEVLS